MIHFRHPGGKKSSNVKGNFLFVMHHRLYDKTSFFPMLLTAFDDASLRSFVLHKREAAILRLFAVACLEGVYELVVIHDQFLIDGHPSFFGVLSQVYITFK